MNNKVACLGAFILGAAIGVTASWKIAQTKYEKIAQEEIDSVKETYSKKRKENIETLEILNDQLKDEIKRVGKVTEEKPDIMKYAAKLQKEGYIDYTSDSEPTENVEDVNAGPKPYVISPEEFGENDFYETMSLTYYADGVLADDTDERIEDVDNIVGYDSLEHFGEYEDDAVHVRNDRLKTDYEIILDERNYYVGTAIDPHPVEV